MSDDGTIPINICPEEVDCVGADELKDMPGLFDMAKNLLKDGSNIVSNALGGNKTLVSDEVREARWAICQGCPMLQNNRCTECGCFMKVKVAFHATSCPLGKWDLTI